MAFVKRTWIARDVQYPGRRIFTPTGNTNEYDVTRSEGTANAEGDIISAENLNDLDQRIYDAFIAAAAATAPDSLKLGGVLAANYPQISSGPWTPTLYGLTTAGSATYASRSGRWDAIGKLIRLRGDITLSSKGGMSGVVSIGGIPFASDAVGADSTAISSPTNDSKTLNGTIDANSSHIDLYLPTGTWLTAADISDNFTIYKFSFAYYRA